MTTEDAPDCGHRGNPLDPTDQVVSDGVGAGVMAGSDELPTDFQDGGLDPQAGPGVDRSEVAET